MSPAMQTLMRRLAAANDALKPLMPPGFKSAIVLVHDTDPDGAVLVGSADPSAVYAALGRALDNPTHAGRLDRDGVLR